MNDFTLVLSPLRVVHSLAFCHKVYSFLRALAFINVLWTHRCCWDLRKLKVKIHWVLLIVEDSLVERIVVDIVTNERRMQKIELSYSFKYSFIWG
jgi:hypothetical protein